jgi:hypothetical protein
MSEIAVRTLILVGGSFLLFGGVLGWLFGYAMGAEAAKICAAEEGPPQEPVREI